MGKRGRSVIGVDQPLDVPAEGQAQLQVPADRTVRLAGGR
jgi:hypothetical protein